MPLIFRSAQSPGNSGEETGCIANRRFMNVRPPIPKKALSNDFRMWYKLYHDKEDTRPRRHASTACRVGKRSDAGGVEDRTLFCGSSPRGLCPVTMI